MGSPITRSYATPSIASILMPSMTSVTTSRNNSNSEDSPTSAPTDRPPGGTVRAGGTKTPRKVQWAVDNPLLYRTLDEHGLDPDAFETLTHALERHQSTSIDQFSRAGVNIPSSSDTSGPGSPTLPAPGHEVPGEHYIDPNERSGLPGTDASRHSRVEAKKVVHAHKRGLFGNHYFRQRKQNQSDHTERRAHRRQSSSYSHSDEDVEKEGQPNLPARFGTGVLSTLLSLYDHQSLGQSTQGSTLSLEDKKHDLANTRGFDFSRLLPNSRPNTPTQTQRTLDSLPSTSKGLRAETWAPTLWQDSRPAVERNAGGVFGALIASTGNITGVAAPAHSTLAPNIKRPGYHLSRYSLESNLPVTKRQHSKPMSRPQSAHFESKTTITGRETLHSTASTSSSHSPGVVTPNTTFGSKTKWTGVLKDLPKRGWASVAETPSTSTPNTEHEDWLDEMRGEFLKKEKKWKRKKAEIFITRHIAEIIQRQEFILKLARAMMMFGGPSHRFQAQIQATAKVLDIELSCMYLPDVMLISFDDATTGTSNIKLIRQAPTLDLEKLQLAYKLYWKVIHDQISVNEASVELDVLMRRKPLYNWWQIIIIGAFCSSWICSVGFNGSFIDSLISFPMGALLVSVQLASVRNELYSNVFEITIATLLSFLSAAFASTHIFCYSAIASSSVVLILPGFIVLIGSLELSSRNIVSGAVRLCYACVYALFLGFGLEIGLEVYQKITGRSVYAANDYMCSASHPVGSPWYRQTPSTWWAFLTVPMYSLFLSLRNQAAWNRKEMPLLVIISCIGWVTNHFTATKFPNQSDISAAVGAFAVGFISNLYGRTFNGNAFAIMITGILFQLPSGLGNGGLLTFASIQTNGTSSTAYLSGFQTALQLISVGVGLTVGLGISLVVVHPVQSKRRAGGVFSL